MEGENINSCVYSLHEERVYVKVEDTMHAHVGENSQARAVVRQLLRLLCWPSDEHGFESNGIVERWSSVTRLGDEMN